MEDPNQIAIAAQDLGDWIERWRHEPDAMALVSPVAKAWLEFVDGHPDLLAGEPVVLDLSKE